MIMFDAISEQQYTLNFKKLNSLITADLLMAVMAEKPLVNEKMDATYPGITINMNSDKMGDTESMIKDSEDAYTEDFDEISRRGGGKSIMNSTR